MMIITLRGIILKLSHNDANLCAKNRDDERHLAKEYLHIIGSDVTSVTLDENSRPEGRNVGS